MSVQQKLKNLLITSADKQDMRISLFIAWFFIINALNTTLKRVFYIDELYTPITLLFAVILGVLLLITIYPVIKRSFYIFLGFEFFAIYIYIYIAVYYRVLLKLQNTLFGQC